MRLFYLVTLHTFTYTHTEWRAGSVHQATRGCRWRVKTHPALLLLKLRGSVERRSEGGRTADARASKGHKRRRSNASIGAREMLPVHKIQLISLCGRCERLCACRMQRTHGENKTKAVKSGSSWTRCPQNRLTECAFAHSWLL